MFPRSAALIPAPPGDGHPPYHLVLMLKILVIEARHGPSAPSQRRERTRSDGYCTTCRDAIRPNIPRVPCDGRAGLGFHSRTKLRVGRHASWQAQCGGGAGLWHPLRKRRKGLHRSAPNDANFRPRARQSRRPGRDLLPFWPNCNTVALRHEPPFTVEELRAIVGLGT